jgi:transaldolase
MKDKSRRDVFYVEQLIGKDTINTMPSETIDAFRDHGVVNDTLEMGIDEARLVFDDVRLAGVDYEDVCAQLERDGVAKFVASFEKLLAGIRAKRLATDTHQGDSAAPR